MDFIHEPIAGTRNVYEQNFAFDMMAKIMVMLCLHIRFLIKLCIDERAAMYCMAEWVGFLRKLWRVAGAVKWEFIFRTRIPSFHI